MLASYEMVFSRHSVEATHMKHQQDNCLKQDLHNGHTSEVVGNFTRQEKEEEEEVHHS